MGSPSSPGFEDLRFGVISDVHLTFRPASQGCDSDRVSTPEARHARFLETAREWNADVVINLGDLHPPSLTADCWQRTIEAWEEWTGESVIALGNHDPDSVDRDAYMDAVGMPAAYYEARVGDWTVFVLSSGDPAYGPGTPVEHPAEEQLDWLRAGLEKADGRCLLVAHNGTNEVLPGGSVPKRMRSLIREVNESATYCKVVGYFWGHDHRTHVERVDGVYHVLVNSATYRWDAEAGPLFYRDPAPYAMDVFDGETGDLRLEGTGVPGNWAIPDCAEILTEATPEDDMTYQASVDDLPTRS